MTRSTRNRDIVKRPPLTARGTPRKRPPKTGTAIMLRLQDEQLDQLDAWMTDHDLLSRPEAVRQILRQVLGEGKRK